MGSGIDKVDYNFHVDNTKDEKIDINVDGGKFSTQLENNRIWYIKEEKNQGLFNKTNKEYFTYDASRITYSRKKDLVVNATYNGETYKI